MASRQCRLIFVDKMILFLLFRNNFLKSYGVNNLSKSELGPDSPRNRVSFLFFSSKHDPAKAKSHIVENVKQELIIKDGWVHRPSNRAMGIIELEDEFNFIPLSLILDEDANQIIR